MNQKEIISSKNKQIFKTQCKKRNEKLHTIEQGLLWNYVNWNKKYVKVLMIWTSEHSLLEIQPCKLHDCKLHQPYNI